MWLCEIVRVQCQGKKEENEYCGNKLEESLQWSSFSFEFYHGFAFDLRSPERVNNDSYVFLMSGHNEKCFGVRITVFCIVHWLVQWVLGQM